MFMQAKLNQWDYLIVTASNEVQPPDERARFFDFDVRDEGITAIIS
jgi:hypothetical protein